MHFKRVELSWNVIRYDSMSVLSHTPHTTSMQTQWQPITLYSFNAIGGLIRPEVVRGSICTRVVTLSESTQHRSKHSLRGKEMVEWAARVDIIDCTLKSTISKIKCCRLINPYQ